MSSFEDKEIEKSYNRGINPKFAAKSRLAQASSPQTEGELKQAAIEQINKSKGYFERLAGLSRQFLNVIKDKTLTENKNLIAKSVEDDLVRDLLSLSQEINEDQDEIESGGSNGLCMLLIKAVFYQRDRINNLEYQLSQIKNSIEK